MKTLFQGDSITHAFRREEEQNLAFQLGNGYAFLIAAQLDAHFPEKGFQFLNKGVCGEGVPELSARWQKDTLAEAPDILSLLIGVNDTVNAMSGRAHPDDAEFARIYTSLLSDFSRQYPASRVVLLEPFLLQAGVVTEDWIAHLKPRQAFIRDFAGSAGHKFIPTQELFDAALSRAAATHWAWDGIHPTHAGFQLIAAAWLEATRSWFAR